MAWLAILIAAGIGYAVTIGLKGHMEKEPPPGDKPKLVPAVSRHEQCLAAFDKLPTGKGPADDTRAAAKIAYLYTTAGTTTMADGSVVNNADAVETLANHCTSIGHPEAGACLREKANELRGGASPAIALPAVSPTMVPIFPTDTGS